MPRREIGGREKQIANFLGDGGRFAGIERRFVSSVSSRIFASTKRASFQSKPTLEAFVCNFTARVKPGRVSGTSSRPPGEVSARSPPASPVSLNAAFFSDLSSRLMLAQRDLTCSGERSPAAAHADDAGSFFARSPRPRRRNRNPRAPRQCGPEKQPGGGDRPVPPQPGEGVGIALLALFMWIRDRTPRPFHDRPMRRHRSRSIEQDRQSLAALWRIDDLHRHGLAFG
jgi:hypothetical protein